MLTARLYTKIPISIDRALQCDPIRWEGGEIRFLVKPFSFAKLELWDRTLRALRFQISGIREIDMNEIMSREAEDYGGPETLREARVAFCKILGMDEIEYLTDLLIAVSEPADPERARATVWKWGFESARPWAVDGFDLREALLDYAAHNFDPVSVSETMHEITLANLKVKKKLLRPGESGKGRKGRPTPLQKVYQTLRKIKESQSETR